MKRQIFSNKVSFIPINQLAGPIYFGWSMSPFGHCLILLQSDIVVGLAFKTGNNQNQKIETLMKAQWTKHASKFKPLNTKKKVENIFFKNAEINISFHGSPFQNAVWKALLEIPVGTTATYSYIAKKTFSPLAVRAVATAIGQNPIAWLIPCHRVIRKSGALGGYRWGLEIKEMMLSKETKI